ncbi:hypothetical protein IZ6_16720 [Terrihabitans soli]|uniref:Uncharacterized protein n=1 Tax=Terrihabitans soli TaxID=708113 RepID=A0A6S6QSL2_9HYPH|nr:hypothetical protein [Terrihabitans soli]BCJ90937.1 hypothetical protein IZ6_16720 [Terrihabitans soli]
MSDRPIFRPGFAAILALAAVSAAALGLALYMRYWVVEPAVVGLACDAGSMTTICVVRRTFIGIFVWYGFGGAALVATALALLRPSNLLIGAALIFGLIGVVNYNTQLSALALALLPLVLARPAPEREFQPE